MMKTLCALTAVMVLAMAGGLLIAGCETTSTVNSAITINPASVDMTASNVTQVFTASMTASNASLVLPLVWSVSDASLGTIQSSVGVQAVYQASVGMVGNNTITVHDQASAEGLAIVRQH